MQKQAKTPDWLEQQWHWEQAGGNCASEQNRKEPTLTTATGRLKERKKKENKSVHLQGLHGKLLRQGLACRKLGPDVWDKYFTGATLYMMLWFNLVCCSACLAET